MTQKKQIKKIKTFPIPFTSKGIKENITLNINDANTPSKEQIIHLALKLHSQGKISEAAESYKYFIDLGFNDYRAFANLGTILKGYGKLKEAKILLYKAIKLKPDSAEVHNNLGSILKNLGKLKEAESSQRKAIKIKPDFAIAHYNLGNILSDLRELEEAEKCTRKAIELNPDLTEAYSNLGNILKDLGKLKEAENYTRKATELSPTYAKAHSNLGIILSDLGKLSEAELSLRKAIEYNPDLAEAHIKLGEILFDLGKPEESKVIEWKAIKILTSSKHLKSYRENAKIIEKTAFWTFSSAIFNHFLPVIEINPDSFEILVPNESNNDFIFKIRNSLKNKYIRIRKINELVENNLIYEKLVSNRGDDKLEYINDENNIQTKIVAPTIKLLGKKNIKFMYCAGKNKYTIDTYWNKFYDGILCFGQYHEDRFKANLNIATAQMGYPRFDKYFNPGFERDYLIKKFKCDSKKKTIVWLPTWLNLSSIDKYHKVISSLRINYNIVVRPHPAMKGDDPESYKKLFHVDFNYIDENSEDDNVQQYSLADLMLFDYGGSMFGALYLNKNFAFLEMNIEAKNNSRLGKRSSEDYLKSYFPDRIANLENLESICNYCLKKQPNASTMKSLREEFFNTNYQGTSGKRAYDILTSNKLLK